MDVYQRRRLVALSAIVGVFVIVVLAVAGGGDDEEAPVTELTGPTGPTAQQELGKAAYISEADRICTEAEASLETIDESDLAAAAASEARTMSGMLQQLRALPPPSRDAPLANRFLRALRTQVEALRDRQLALERDDGAALAELDARLATAETEAQETAEAFGFEVCGDPAATGEALDETGAPIEPAPVEPAPAPEPAPEPAPAPAPPPPAPGDGGGTGGSPPGGTGGVSP